MKREFIIGVDVGGSHVSCCAFDIAKKELLSETLTEKKVDGHAAADQIIGDWAMALKQTMDKTVNGKLLGIGFAMPGPFNYVQGIGLFDNVGKFISMKDFNVLKALKKKMDIPDEVELRFINDATAFALGEAASGKGQAFDKVAVITLGTGVGSAFIEDRIPVLTGHQVPSMGCIWHLPYRNGIADEYFSTRWFTSEYKKLTGTAVKGVKELADKVSEDSTARQLFRIFGTNLGDFIAPHLNKFNAGVLVIGGNISKANRLFLGEFVNALKKNNCRTQVKISDLNEDAAMLGCAVLFDKAKWKDIQPTLKHM